MKLTVTEDRLLQLEGVYLPIVLLTDKGERFIISMRDGGFEFRYNGKPYRAVNGVLSEVITEQPEQINEIECTPEQTQFRRGSNEAAEYLKKNAPYLLNTVNGISGNYNPDNDYMKVAERLFYEQNSYTPKLDVPSIMYEYAERWHKEFRNDNTWVGTFYDWCIEYKQPKKKDHSNDEDKVGSGN